MEGPTNIDLNQLRQIGWDIWNPIGLDDEWRADAPDEYDTYLWHVASMALRGISQDEAAAYLIGIASDHMGLSAADPVAAQATASAIAAYVESVR
jgi:hypothetical protein